MSPALQPLRLARARALLLNAEARLDHAQAALAAGYSNHPFPVLDRVAACVEQRRKEFSAALQPA